MLALLKFFVMQRHQLYSPFIDYFGHMLLHSLNCFGVNSNVVALISESLRDCNLEIPLTQLRNAQSESRHVKVQIEQTHKTAVKNKAHKQERV